MEVSETTKFSEFLRFSSFSWLFMTTRMIRYSNPMVQIYSLGLIMRNRCQCALSNNPDYSIPIVATFRFETQPFPCFFPTFIYDSDPCHSTRCPKHFRYPKHISIYLLCGTDLFSPPILLFPPFQIAKTFPSVRSEKSTYKQETEWPRPFSKRERNRPLSGCCLLSSPRFFVFSKFVVLARKTEQGHQIFQQLSVTFE